MFLHLDEKAKFEVLSLRSAIGDNVRLIEKFIFDDMYVENYTPDLDILIDSASRIIGYANRLEEIFTE